MNSLLDDPALAARLTAQGAEDVLHFRWDELVRPGDHPRRADPGSLSGARCAGWSSLPRPTTLTPPSWA